MTTIIQKTRFLIQDQATNTSDIFTHATSSIYTLSESNIVSITTVYRNNTPITTYTYNSTTQKITISSTLVAGDTVQIDYSYYPNYSDNEIIGYINSALIYLGNYNYQNFEVESGNNIYPIPTSQEEKLIAMITSILIEPNNQNIRLPDISISASENLSINQRIDKVLSSFKHNIHGLFEVL